MQIKNLIYLSHIIIFLLLSCGDMDSNKESIKQKDNIQQQFTLLSSAKTGIDFNNDLVEDISKQMDVLSYQYYLNGGGVALIDINNDGLSDVYLTANTGSNKLYLNKGNFKFEDITESAGVGDIRWSTGATVADVNNDGWDDLYVCNAGQYGNPNDRKNRLYINKRNNTFVDKAAKYKVDDSNRSDHASFFDYDKDGDLDLYVMNHSTYFRTAQNVIDRDLKKPGRLELASGKLFRNNGDLTFTNVTKEAGLLRYGYGLGLVTSDINGDGWPDIYVTNDYTVPDFCYINNGDGTFTNKVKELTNQIPWFSMGCDIADFNNDGFPDIAVVDMASEDHVRGKTLMTSMDPGLFRFLVDDFGYQYQYMFNSFQLNNGNNHFSNIANLAGNAKTDWSWAAFFADFDNDGQKDYFVSNGYLRYAFDNDFRKKMQDLRDQSPNNIIPMDLREQLYSEIPTVKLPNRMFRNNGDLSFTDLSDEWGVAQPSYSNGAAFGDLDNDGDLDLIVNNIHENAFVYRNNAEKAGDNNYLRLKLLRKNKNDQVLNTKISIYYGDEVQYQEFTLARGYQGSMESTVHFGLGPVSMIDRLVIEWPDGKVKMVENVQANQLLKIDRSTGVAYEIPESVYDNIFKEITADKSGLDFIHKENAFDDLLEEVLLPHMQSKLGPLIGSGDANGDGLDDIYIGGAKDQPGTLYFQTNNNSFVKSGQAVFEKDSKYEDMGSLFFDANGNGLLDLYVVSGGGNEFEAGSEILQDRLYINQGKGQYKLSDNLPTMNTSGSRVKAADYDSDGDLDLFIGGRVVPGKYPSPPRSYLLQNNNGQFKDVTAEVAPDLLEPGLVTDFIWTDFNDDNLTDLVVVGEWMPVKFLKNDGNTFTDVTSELGQDKNTGWWYSIAEEDLDNDGDMDYVVGNIGMNTKFNASDKKPLSVYYADFDNNGTGDIVLAKDYHGKTVPVRGRECSSEQMPFIKDKFPSYKSFAEASLPEIYGDVELQEALHLEARTFYTIVLINNGTEGFTVKHLPNQAQVSPTNGIVLKDFNNDGYIDILLAGNMYQTEPETPRYDAGVGCYLKGNGKGEFKAASVLESGFFSPGDVKDIRMINLGADKREAIIVTNNSGPVQLFEVKEPVVVAER
ncbi:MAG: VCBS repeat-containing protein [Chitinophagales bacterium]|nr:VCBS repeat-containing protein [Chitinophagales bacterium]